MDAEMLIPISMFGSIFGIVYIFLKTRSIERLALIEHGAKATIFDRDKKTGNMTLKLGMLAIGIAAGVLIGSLLDEYTALDEQAYFAMIFLFGGLGLVFNDFIERKRNPKSN